MVALVRNEKEIALLFLYLLVLNIYLVSRSLFACVCVCVVCVFDCGDVCMRECLLMYDVVVFVGFSCV